MEAGVGSVALVQRSCIWTNAMMINNLGVDLGTFQLCASWYMLAPVRVSYVAPTVRQHHISCDTELVSFSIQVGGSTVSCLSQILRIARLLGLTSDIVLDRPWSDVLRYTSKLHDTFDSISI